MYKVTLTKQTRTTKPAERPRKQNSKYQIQEKCDLYSFEVIVGPISSEGEYGVLLLYLSFLSHENSEFLNNDFWA